ncbi:hypothetical protein RN001_005605 [Aquatica leii]|uniref:Regulatory protein zeste n=1 Tax=Aquatica leii TaxID=1421715 RepID=A0AAN7SAN8_9COLE|nr:hypothetical protein RN001_005605 [Aquatica leii]
MRSALKKKRKAWESITSDFNKITTEKRSVCQLKRFCDKIKRKRKLELAEERCNIISTGGGPSKTPPRPQPEIDNLIPYINYEVNIDVDSDTANLITEMSLPEPEPITEAGQPGTTNWLPLKQMIQVAPEDEDLNGQDEDLGDENEDLNDEDTDSNDEHENLNDKDENLNLQNKNDDNDDISYEPSHLLNLTDAYSISDERKYNKKKKGRHIKGLRRVYGSKKPWSAQERGAAKKHFGKYLEMNNLPSISILCEELRLIAELKERSPTSVKSWLQNELVNRKSTFFNDHNPNKKKRTRWTSDMKDR